MRILAILIFIVSISFSAHAQTRTIAMPVSLNKPDAELTAGQLTEKAKYGIKSLTGSEISARNIEEAAWLAAKPLDDWQTDMDFIGLSDDHENIIDALDEATRTRIDAATLDKYNAKKTLRAAKP